MKASIPRCFGFAVLILSVLFAASTTTLAQGLTTATVSGIVTDQDGNPLPGANVIARHEPTGTTYGAAARADGRFNIPNLRVGGPYTITASFVGFRSSSEENVTLELSQNLRLDFSLVDDAIELAQIEVLGEINPILSAGRTGAANNVSTEQIERLPTIERRIQDFTRLAPQIVGTNVSGRNFRYNNVQVDGAVLNDVFGLGGSGGMPGGQVNTQPINLDAIQEFRVAIAPYDVRENGFTGGSINAITRSGTNRWTGSAYWYGRNENLVGLSPDALRQKLDEFGEFQAGFRLGGPIQEDRLFFFAAGEIGRRNDPIEVGFAGSGAANVFNVPRSTLDEIVSIAQNQYGYNAGGYDRFIQNQNNDKLFIRFDYNISDRHRLTLRHNYVDGNLDRGAIRGTTTLALNSQAYVFNSQQNATVAELNSTLGSNIANTARIAYTAIRDNRDYEGASPFPQVSIFLDSGELIRFGMERFSHANALDQDIFEFTNDLTIFTGNHTITLGTSNQLFSFSNLFIQDFYGSYEFRSYTDTEGNPVDAIEAFRRGRPSRYFYSWSLLDDPQPWAEWTTLQLGFYAQTEWAARPNLSLTFGLRADIPIFLDDPLFNPTFTNDFPQYRTDEVPSGNILWSPRFGFNWDATGTRSTQVRGGVGIFSGRTPGVWLSNQYSNTGMDFGRVDERNLPEGFFSNDPNNQPRPGDGSGLQPIETTEVNITDPDFRHPQLLRTNIAVDQQLPLDLIGTFEVLYSQAIYDIMYQNLNVGDFESVNAADGRWRHTSARQSDNFTNVMLLENTNKGYQYSITGQLQRLPREGFFGSVSYTYSQAFDMNSGTSSRAISNWVNNVVSRSANNPRLERSLWETRHRILAAVSYQFPIRPRWNTTISFIYEGREGRPFSYVYNGDLTNDGNRFNNTVYIPTSMDEYVCEPFPGDNRTPEMIWAQFNQFVNSDPHLSKYRGKITPRNIGREPWIHQLDLRFAQLIPTLGTQRIELTLDILNVLNLINRDWGLQKFHTFQSYNLLTFRGYTPGGTPIVRYNHIEDRDDTFQIDDILSRWQIQFGVRYTF